jgi:hypothetical protein
MIKPISLRLRYTEAIERARTTLIRAGRGDELKRADSARAMRQARATVERRRKQDRLRQIAVLQAQKAILAVNRAYAAQDQLDADEAERARWHAGRAVILDELNKIIAQGRRP